MNTIDVLELEQMKKNVPPFKVGDTVKVQVKIVEGDKQRIQAYQGVVIGRQGGSIRESFTVRKNFQRNWRRKEYSRFIHRISKG